MQRTLVILSALLLMLLVGCRQTTSDTADLTITVDVSPELTVGEATLLISVIDAEGNPITDATINVRGDMSHAGMTPVIREVAESNADGVYEVPFEWTMGGDWLVEVTATLPDGTSATERFDYTVETDGDMQDMDMDMDTNTDTNETTAGSGSTSSTRTDLADE